MNIWHFYLKDSIQKFVGVLSQKVGRKISILVASVVFTIGSVVMGVANNKEILLVGRLIVGAAIGFIG